MSYDLTPTRQLLDVLKQRELTKAERAIAREQIGRYYAKKLASLQQNLFEALEKHHTGELDPFDVDEYIHRYHKQSQELYVYMNTLSSSNANLPFWLKIIEADEQGRNVWQPKATLPHETQSWHQRNQLGDSLSPGSPVLNWYTLHDNLPDAMGNFQRGTSYITKATMEENKIVCLLHAVCVNKKTVPLAACLYASGL